MHSEVNNELQPFTHFFSDTAKTKFNQDLTDLRCQLYVCSNEDLPPLQDKIKRLERSLKFLRSLTK